MRIPHLCKPRYDDIWYWWPIWIYSVKLSFFACCFHLIWWKLELISLVLAFVYGPTGIIMSSKWDTPSLLQSSRSSTRISSRGKSSILFSKVHPFVTFVECCFDPSPYPGQAILLTNFFWLMIQGLARSSSVPKSGWSSTKNHQPTSNSVLFYGDLLKWGYLVAHPT